MKRTQIITVAISLIVVLILTIAGVIVVRAITNHGRTTTNGTVAPQYHEPNPDGSCPDSYVQYGEPLNKCVSRQYYNACFVDKTQACPL